MKESVVPYFSKETEYTCAPAACRMVLAYFGIHKPEVKLTKELQTSLIEGTHPQNIENLFNNYNFKTLSNLEIIEKNDDIIAKLKELIEDKYLVIALVNRVTYDTITPFVNTEVYWENPNESLHYIVISSVNENSITINDPHKVIGVHLLIHEIFLQAWCNWFVAVKQ